MPTADQIADAIILFRREHGRDTTPLGLQKLLYYAQAWHLALDGTRMFDGEFEAWVHGPVHRPTWERFRHVPRHLPIPADELAEPAVGEEVYDHVADVMRAYGHLDDYQLELLTHDERPWREARGGLPPFAACRNVIADQAMRDFYAAKAAA